MASKLRVGIVGMGAIGTVHANAYQAVEDIEIAAICDADEKALARASKAYGVSNTFSDYRELIKTDIDAVNVSVGNALHREVAVAALQAGKHVFLEKPMAMNAGEAQEIVKASGKSGKVLQIGMCWRYDSQSHLVRQYLEEGILGEIYHIRAIMVRRRGIPGLGGWFTTKAKSGGGPMIDLGVHWFDLSMYLSGLWNPTSVSAKTYAKFGPRMKDYVYVGMWAGPPKLDGVCDVEDYSTGFVRFGEKATMSFEIVWACNAESRSYIELLGDKGGIRGFGGGNLTLYTEHAGKVADIQPQYAQDVNRYEEQARGFVANCRGETIPAAATGKQGLTVMKLIDAIYASSEAGKEVNTG
jgi:predicted dehydrogenase